MRLVSWNIRGGKHPDVVNSVVTLKPDVAVLVDCKAKHVDRIVADAAKHGYTHHLENCGVYRGLVMLSRAPLSLGEIKPYKGSHRWLHGVSDHFRLEIAAVYSPLPKAYEGDPTMSEFWSWVISACDLIVDRQAVLCGDFNTGVDEADGPARYHFRGANPFGELVAHGWKDAYRELHVDGEQRSWWWNRERGFRIDHCMLSRGQPAPSGVEYVQELAAIRTEPLPADGLKAAALPDHAALVVDF